MYSTFFVMRENISCRNSSNIDNVTSARVLSIDSSSVLISAESILDIEGNTLCDG